jgi:hypothetical protein
MIPNFMMLILTSVIAVLFYVLDVFFFHLSASFHLSIKGVVTHLWMLWFVYTLCEFKYRKVGIMALVMSSILAVHGVQSWFEVFLPMLILLTWAMTYHAFFVLSSLFQKRFFIFFTYGFWLGLVHIKMAMNVSEPFLYLWDMKWVWMMIFNIGLFLLIGERLFTGLNKWMVRQYVDDR